MNDRSTDSSSDIDIEEIRAFYDSVYYANATAGESAISGHYRRLFRRLNPGTGIDVLDVACGAGGWAWCPAWGGYCGTAG